MAVTKHTGNLYDEFCGYSYLELEELVSKAKDDDEREFYFSLCDAYHNIHQPRVMRERPF